MQKKNDLLNKFVKKNFNNELEEVLEKKAFDENVKSFLLSVLYKIEAGYKDYKQVKQDVETKEEFIKKLIENIKNNCSDIKLVQPGSQEADDLLRNGTFLVEKVGQRIICYPIERKLLYCISKISKKDIIIKEKNALVNETLSDLINVGNNINTVEPIRDFNGYSWITITKEIESIPHNLVYQNLRILLGTTFLNKWINNKDYIIDYLEKMKNCLEENYGQDDEFIEQLIILSILLKIKLDSKFKNNMEKNKKEIEERLEEIQDNTKFVEEMTEKKRVLTSEIKNIDETMNDKEKLQVEYDKRNEKLELNKKIFSIRILSKIMLEEREAKIKELEELNELMKPHNFVKYKSELEEKYEYLKMLEIDNYDKKIAGILIRIQEIFLKCLEKRIEKIETKKELIELIYEYRYYCLIPFDKQNNIWQVEILQERLSKVSNDIIQKAYDLKLINTITQKKELNYEIIKNIFKTRIINLEELNIKITKNKNIYYLQLFDDNAAEEKIELSSIELDKKDFEIKLNKKVKIFN